MVLCTGGLDGWMDVWVIHYKIHKEKADNGWKFSYSCMNIEHMALTSTLTQITPALPCKLVLHHEDGEDG